MGRFTCLLARLLACLCTVLVTGSTKMDRETIELVLNSVSPSCKEEMEVALTSPAEITARCELLPKVLTTLQLPHDGMLNATRHVLTLRPELC